MAECEHGEQCDDQGHWFKGAKEDCSVQKTPFPYAIDNSKSDMRVISRRGAFSSLHVLHIAITHFIVWAKRPLLHPCIVPRHYPPRIRSAAWRVIQTVGLSGSVPLFTVPDPALVPGYREDEQHQIRLAISESGRFIRAVIQSTWDQHTHEVAWFANPPSLQSLPTLPHWHCMIRKRMT